MSIQLTCNTGSYLVTVTGSTASGCRCAKEFWKASEGLVGFGLISQWCFVLVLAFMFMYGVILVLIHTADPYALIRCGMVVLLAGFEDISQCRLMSALAQSLHLCMG